MFDCNPLHLLLLCEYIVFITCTTGHAQGVICMEILLSVGLNMG